MNESRAAAILAIFLALTSYGHGARNTIKIGAIFHGKAEVETAVLHYAVKQIRMHRTAGQFDLEPIIKTVEVDTDGMGAATAACELLSEGVAAIFGPKSAHTRSVVASIAAHHDVPHIEYAWRPVEESQLESTTINVYPPGKNVSEAIAALTTAMPWKQFIAIYETDDGLSRIQDALKLHEPQDDPVTVRQLGEGLDYRSLLKDVATSRDINILLDVEYDNLIRVLQQAKEVNLMKDYHTYIISGLNFPDHRIVENFRQSPANITGLGLMKDRKDELKDALDLDIKVEDALLYDAIFLFKKSLDALNLANIDAGSPLNLVPKSLACNSVDSYSAGRNLTKAIRSETRVDELTGPMEFDEFGQRQTFQMHVWEFYMDRFQTIAIQDFEGFRLTRSAKERQDDIESKIQNNRYKVTTRLGSPYFMEMPPGSTEGVVIGEKRYYGYSVDLIHAISQNLKFDYEFELVPDGNYGSYSDVNKTWDGLVRRLQDREADLAICDLTINHQRESAVDFTMPFMNLGISILHMKVKDKEPDLFSFLSPFTIDVWIYVATAYLAVSLALFFLARIAPGEWDNPHPCNPNPEELENSFNLMNSMWLSIGSLLQQGSDILPKAPSIRMVAGMWWFFTLIMTSSYTANLAAFLTAGKMGDSITSAEDLATQSSVKYGAVEGGSTSMFFKNSNNSVYQRMWAAMMEARPSVFTKNNDEGVQRVLNSNSKYAFIMESTSIEYYVARSCDLEQIGGFLDNKGYGIAMPLNSPYRTLFSEAVLKLQEKGILQKMKDKWWKERDLSEETAKCNNTEEAKTDSDDLELGLPNVGGVFVVLMCGVSAACVVAMLEFLWNVRKVAVDEMVTPWEAFKAEFRFAINIWAETKPVKVAKSSNRSSTSALHTGAGPGRAASVARSLVGSFLRLDMIDKFEKDNTSNTRSGNQRKN
ncbi:glutamate receptor ionotropic, kainate 2-like [Diprion similis]|uniref:glutamate receptor ionotropic, kainate 2-like n=1 Tax=Diprion similis TaxID=362088 RepID=UPI001EF8E5B7|nr:glutamate receptor ionotropic, kainate 2-like [Diprion similis]XP_046751604.1 glutamate receptor ionotropic, kainate 2-like [Diprion similis]